LNLLKDILYKTGIVETIGSTDRTIHAVCIDSRIIKKGDLYVALKGSISDGHSFIENAIEKGAVAIVCEELPKIIQMHVSYIVVKDTHLSVGIIASNFYDNPCEQIKLIGVTGTNGKTTTVTLLYKLFKGLGYKTGLLSTVRNYINEKEINATHTTPDAVTLNQLLKQMVDSGCEYCFMEVSSHAVVQNRIAGLVFAGGVFTNITHDHLDYHKTFDEYVKAKKGFFDSLSSDAFALSNIDDKNGTMMLQNTKASRHTYSLKKLSDFRVQILENQFTGLHLKVDNIDVWCKLVGKFNAYNLLAIYATSILLKQPKQDVLTLLSNLESVEGRFEYIISLTGTVGIVDYAHTPDALLNVIHTINSIREGKGRLIAVVGCGGDRDKTKRPEMAKIACEGCEKVILTSDNPRSEEASSILDDMIKGVEFRSNKKILTIENRKEAIKTACSMANSDDIILVAGKGHEKYQEIKGVKYPFDDKEILKEFIQ